MNSNKLAVAALRKQIRTICFDANLFDRGMADYPYAKECSRKKKMLLATIAELEGNLATKSKKTVKVIQNGQLELFK